MADLQIGPLRIGRGEFVTGRLPFFRLADGTEIALPVQVWRGAKDGPTLCLVANQHGNEFKTISVFGELIKQLNPAEMSGTVIGLPIANPFSFAACSRNTWLDGLNGNDGNLNRVWPGRQEAWTTEQMAYRITETILPLADVVIDFHNGTHTLAIYYSYITAVAGELGDRITELSKSFGLEILIKRPAIRGSLTEYVTQNGTPAWAVELGEFYGFPDDRAFTPRVYPEVGFTGVMNVLGHMGILKREQVLPRRRVILESALVGIGPKTGGLLVSEVGVKDIGRVVPGGYILGRILDPLTFQLQAELVAPLQSSFIVAVTPTKPLLPINPGAGDWGYYVADNDRATWEEVKGGKVM